MTMTRSSLTPFLCALLLSAAGTRAFAGGKAGSSKTRKKPSVSKPAAQAKKKEADVESKYKSRVLAENTESAYRFDANGNPISPSAKPKAAREEKKSSEESAEEKPAEEKSTEKCSVEEPCAEKPTDADAL